MQDQKLTLEEKHIIIDKGTEAPFSGEYNQHDKQGTYLCKQCHTPLFWSRQKFASGCGWPSFAGAIPGAVYLSPDEDGCRTEITCVQCGGHLGHIFVGERSNESSVRHCVNSLSLDFTPEVIESNYSVATLGGGCFWCLESAFQQLKGVVEVRPGYAGGEETYPTYEQVCKGKTSHAEVVQIFFNPQKVTYQQLLEVFFTIHDPTQLNRQGNDVGSQYRSIILYHDEEQKDIADNLITKLEGDKIFDKSIMTEIKPLDRFWLAEGYHHNYYRYHSDQAYCQIVINPKLEKVRERWAGLIKS